MSFEWKRSKAGTRGFLTVADPELRATAVEFSRQRERWWHVRVLAPERDGSRDWREWTALHSAMVSCSSAAMDEAERAVRAAIRMYRQPKDPIHDTVRAVQLHSPSGGDSMLAWGMAYGSDAQIAEAWNSSRSPHLMLTLAGVLSTLYEPPGLPWSAHRWPVSRILSGLCCDEVHWPGRAYYTRYEIMRSKAGADDIRRRLPVPTLAQCLAAITRNKQDPHV